MKTIKTIALAAAMAVAVPAGSAHAQALSRDVGVPLQEAGDFLRSGNTRAALARVRTARAAADSAQERRKVAEMAAAVYTRAGQYTNAARELEQIGAGASQLAPLYYRAGNYDRAIQLARRMGNLNGQRIIAQSYIKQGRHEDAANLYQQLIDRFGAREDWLENLAGAQYKAGNKAAYLETTERLIKIDPSPPRWRALLNDLKAEALTRDAKLALYQLLLQTDNVTRPEDYQEFAKFAIVAEVPGVAREVVRRGIEADQLSEEDPQVVRILESSERRQTQIRESFPTLRRGPLGYYRAANAFFAEGNYEAAAVAYWRAVKMETPTKNQALIGLGISALRAGNPSIAAKAFDMVEQDSAFNEVAALWQLYTETRSS